MLRTAALSSVEAALRSGEDRYIDGLEKKRMRMVEALKAQKLKGVEQALLPQSEAEPSRTVSPRLPTPSSPCEDVTVFASTGSAK